MYEHDGCADEKVDDDVEDNRACGRQGCDGTDGDKTPGEPAYKGKPHVEQVLAVLFLLHEEQDERHKSEPEHSLVLVERGEIPHEAVYQADEACSYAGEERDFDEN